MSLGLPVNLRNTIFYEKAQIRFTRGAQVENPQLKEYTPENRKRELE